MKLSLLMIGIILTFPQNAFGTNLTKSDFEQVNTQIARLQINTTQKQANQQEDDDDPNVPTY